ncbi:MAG: S-adenosylmethionine:tRNA ribosyltransferase-isomerase [Chloroflexi bacterium]|nr:S-adenosylmethionine:tRNA ribosyltransferase-isomerase [Chloroflexota bacterium]
MSASITTLQDTPAGQWDPLAFRLPPDLEAGEPPEARGLARDEVRLMVTYRAAGRVVHTDFRRLPELLRPGDVLVINTSGTLNASLPARRPNDQDVELHLSTHLPGDIWAVEVRVALAGATKTLHASVGGETLALPDGALAHLHAPYRCGCGGEGRPAGVQNRLWLATLDLPRPLHAYLERHGSPIRYGYVREEWPNSYYQTVYATEVGSAEMPSAGRPFTPELLTRLVARGVQVAPLLLHTGVASPEAHEPPYEEFYRVPSETARLVTMARAAGRRIVAVGTTVVRALETVTDPDGTTYPGEGWTCTVVTPARGVRGVNALLTGLHEPRSSHLAMLEALAGREHLGRAYAEAVREGYLWHEFGDVHLILP